MGVKVSNNAFGTLSAAINTTATTITLDSGQGARFPTLGASDYFFGTIVDTSNNIEVVKVTARSTDSLTVVRGQDSTSATAFAIGDRFELRPTAALFEAIKDESTVSSDTTPALGGNLDAATFDIDDVGEMSIGLDGVTQSGAAGRTRLHLKGGGATPPTAVYDNYGVQYIEDEEARLQLISDDSGGGGSAVILSNETKHWAMHHKAAGASGTDTANSFNIHYTVATSAGDFAQDGTDYLRVTSDGEVLTPSNPAFHAYGTGNNVNANLSSGTVVEFKTELFDRGGVYNTSNGRFTAPTDGVYMVGWTSIGNNSNDTYRMFLLINGSKPYGGDVHFRIDTSATGSEYGTNGMFCLPLDLNKNDYVQVSVQSDIGNSFYGSSSATNEYWRFWGYLVG